ncbi:MAG TPA: hypothetical protein VLG71_01020 [Candidatus Limnocylindria bacterium]|nr:hypothetical protein [Candidatus Limnocylindria bacterium]
MKYSKSKVVVGLCVLMSANVQADGFFAGVNFPVTNKFTDHANLTGIMNNTDQECKICFKIVAKAPLNLNLVPLDKTKTVQVPYRYEKDKCYILAPHYRVQLQPCAIPWGDERLENGQRQRIEVTVGNRSVALCEYGDRIVNDRPEANISGRDRRDWRNFTPSDHGHSYELIVDNDAIFLEEKD